MPGTATSAGPLCPLCSGQMFDNRVENDERLARGEKMRPDFKCRNRTCEGVIWRPKAAEKGTPGRQTTESQTATAPAPTPAPTAPMLSPDFAALCERYRECVVYVKREIAPHITLDAQAIAAMSATIFIARNQKGV